MFFSEMTNCFFRFHIQVVHVVLHSGLCKQPPEQHQDLKADSGGDKFGPQNVLEGCSA